MLNATWLETFTTLCEAEHFTRTAARLNMTQPGVSQHLRKLEAQVGQSLITRQGKSFTLTPAGEAVLAFGQSRRAQEDALRSAITADNRDSGTVRIACSGSFAMLLYPALMPWMQAAADLAIHLQASPQAQVLSGLIDGQFDVGVLDADPGHPRLQATHLGEEELCLVLPADAPDTPPSFADLQARGMIGHPDGDAYADDLLHLNFPGAYPGADRLRVRGFVNQIGQIPAPVAQGVGYTLLPRSGVEAFARRDLLKVVHLAKRRRHPLWLAGRRGRTMSARLQYASELIALAAGQLS
ncbi:LysR family transcriptional regulator [Loktanella salsilacus]|jgi:DNA-binding transcriptional LysR family regulator|uniref:LysR family transcriptional regulator n=1 Tax=Loktanella salsilacus TaxID=195913 RepID=UPI0020B71A49|nr:LysR family transcriptional regulator [Loktanella salsilacus]UTH45088.1 LysR family transcriptional regulator [Loktanella salsilacus]